MSYESLMAASQRLVSSAEALAALGAALRLRRDGTAVDSQVRELLQEVVGAIEPQLFDGVDAKQEGIILAFIEALMYQARDLLEHPGRPPGWVYDDPVVLQAQGQASQRIVQGIEALAKRLPDLHDTLYRPGTFLDIGTGVGMLAIEAARTWPTLNVIGIDVWEPSLALARKNIAGSGMGERVTLRVQDAQQLDDRDTFTLAWLPGPFIPRDVVLRALDRIGSALRSGGWLVFGLFGAPQTPLGEALTRLRIVRGGGHPWSTDEAAQQLRRIGLDRIEVFAPGPPILFVVGRKP
jgi:SAM-dependent methyltransferase